MGCCRGHERQRHSAVHHSSTPPVDGDDVRPDPLARHGAERLDEQRSHRRQENHQSPHIDAPSCHHYERYVIVCYLQHRRRPTSTAYAEPTNRTGPSRNSTSSGDATSGRSDVGVYAATVSAHLAVHSLRPASRCVRRRGVRGGTERGYAACRNPNTHTNTTTRSSC